MPDTQYFTNIDGKYVKDAEARADLADLEAYVGTITPVALSADSNGTYTAPEGVFGYSPVTVNVQGISIGILDETVIIGEIEESA